MEKAQKMTFIENKGKEHTGMENPIRTHYLN